MAVILCGWYGNHEPGGKNTPYLEKSKRTFFAVVHKT